MKANARKWVGLLCAVVLYYVVHEGAHALVALGCGALREVRTLGLGVQVVLTDRAALTDLQFALFNAAGAAASLLTAYALVLLTKRICASRSQWLRAICYYAVLLLLLNDPVYLSLLCGFFGGGDMNGIVFFGVSEGTARLFFGAVGAFNLWLFARRVYPAYKRSFTA